MTGRQMVALAGVLGALGVMLGAFGAHALKDRLEASALATFETGVRYQLAHVLALFAVGIWMMQQPQPLLRAAAGCLAGGIVLFSGSLYLLATRDLLPFGTLRWLGPVTPIGGLCLIAGWLLVALAAWRGRPA